MTRLPVCTAAALVVVAVSLSTAAPAQAIPAFARKYNLACNTCHRIYPQLTRFGRDFRDNGFRMPDEIDALLKRRTGPAAPAQPPPENFWSFIPEQIPFSIQGKMHGVINPKGEIKTDVQLEELQLQTGGTFTARVSYYLHHHLVEEGEPGDLYTGWVRFNNLLQSNWLNVTAGQFELPLSFSPEIERLSAFEYLAFDRTLGANTFNLNRPQLGIQVFGQSERGTKLWAGIANGSGLSIDEKTEAFDNNSFKDLYGRVAQEVGEHVFGGYVYYGRANGVLAPPGAFTDDFIRVGGDAFVDLGRVSVSGTALYASDDNPLGLATKRTFYGGFVQGDVYLTDRGVVLVRVDGVHQRLPARVEKEESEQDEAPFRADTVAVTPGIQYLVRPNVKLGFEYQVRQVRRDDRAIAQLHMSF